MKDVKDKVSIVSIVAVLTVFGAGALQIAVAVATITQPGIQVAVCAAIICAVIMDALVIHHMGTEPTNRKQFGVGLFMVIVLLVGLVLDVVLLLTHGSFDNATFGWTRALVGINIAVSLVLAAAFFALSETNTHERQMKSLEQKSEMRQANVFHNSPHAARLYSVTATTKFIERAADSLNITVDEMMKIWNDAAPEIAKPLASPVQESAQPGASVLQQTAPPLPPQPAEHAPKA